MLPREWIARRVPLRSRIEDIRRCDTTAGSQVQHHWIHRSIWVYGNYLNTIRITCICSKYISLYLSHTLTFYCAGTVATTSASHLSVSVGRVIDCPTIWLHKSRLRLADWTFGRIARWCTYSSGHHRVQQCRAFLHDCRGLQSTTRNHCRRHWWRIPAMSRQFAGQFKGMQRTD